MSKTKKFYKNYFLVFMLKSENNVNKNFMFYVEINK